MTLATDKALNLKNVNTDLTNLVNQFTNIFNSAGIVVEELSGPSVKQDSPVPSNSASSALLSAIYSNLQQLDYLATNLAALNTELVTLISGEATGSEIQSSATSFRSSNTVPVATTPFPTNSNSGY